MKKAKVMLTGIALFAVIGGALAYNSSMRLRHRMYVPAAPGQACTTTTSTYATTTNTGTLTGEFSPVYTSGTCATLIVSSL